MQIDFITLACAGDCADIEAVARGGNPPYAFTWEDGSRTAKRRVCLDADAALRVDVKDTAIDDDEFEYEAQTAHADITATVLDCSDAGVVECAAPSALPPEGTFSGAYHSDVLAGLSGGTATLTITNPGGTHYAVDMQADLAALLHANIDLQGDPDCTLGELVLRGIESGNGADGRLWVVTLRYDAAAKKIHGTYASHCVPGAVVCTMVTVTTPPPEPHATVAACGNGVSPCGDSGHFDLDVTAL